MRCIWKAATAFLGSMHIQKESHSLVRAYKPGYEGRNKEHSVLKIFLPGYSADIASSNELKSSAIHVLSLNFSD